MFKPLLTLVGGTASRAVDKMADAGFGAPTQKRARDVLERLKARSAGNDPSKRKNKSDKPNAA